MSGVKRKAAEIATDAKKAKKNASITSFFGAPKTVNAVAAKFDKQKWIAGLTAEQKDLLKLEIDTLDDSWLPHLSDLLVSPSFLNLKRFLKQEIASGKVIYPPMKDVYSWYVMPLLQVWGPMTALTMESTGRVILRWTR